MCATSFIISVVQHLKIGDLTKEQSRLSHSSDDEDAMECEQEYSQSVDADVPVLSREDERSLVRDSTAGFAGNFIFHNYVHF